MNNEPKPLTDEQLYGPIGEVVKRISPYTEASQEALYFQLISALGCMSGRNVHQIIDGKEHHMRIFPVLVGNTSFARKGTSLTWVERICRLLDEAWASLNWAGGGLSTGEGLIYSIRDASKSRTKKEIDDPGVDDKRMIFCEEEFARLLKAMSRDTNTLSSIIRSAWDGINLQSYVKSNPYRATSPHVSIIAHITAFELYRCLRDVEGYNGFVNRFLWVCTKRSKKLPHGAEISDCDLESIVQVLKPGLYFASKQRKITLAPETYDSWESVYNVLNTEYPGAYGASITRGSAQVRRLAMTFANFDASEVITPIHLQAAIDAWNYCQGSCRWLWSDSRAGGDHKTNKLLEALGKVSNGLSRTEISKDVFKNNAMSDDIDRILDRLSCSGLARYQDIDTGGVRKERRWYRLDINSQSISDDKPRTNRKIRNDVSPQAEAEVNHDN